ncbi:MAG: OmpA family protein [Paracoccaceae bacterium]|jgi:OOP family OmpA-OmpF porin
MRKTFLIYSFLTFLLAAGGGLVAGWYAVGAIERFSEISVRQTLDEADLGWAEVSADGLRVVLSGIAPDEATRFTAVSTTGGIVEASRIIDEMDVLPSKALAPPAFTAEILRNSSGITVIGLLPHSLDRAALEESLAAIAGDLGFSNLIETADYPVPRGWEDAMSFAMLALRDLPRSKISVAAGQVSITANTDSVEDKDRLTKQLARSAPPGLRLALEISAPRPVITPFTLRFILDEQGARFDACSAESEDSRDVILRAARIAGMTDTAICTIGLGVPSPNWSVAAAQSLNALSELGGGSITMANVDITLVALEGTKPELFERVAGELENALPNVFSLHTVLPVALDETDSGVPEFTATLSPEGLVQIRGRVGDEQLRMLADSYAQARFGSANVYFAARVVKDLPVDWPIRVLTGLEALSKLHNGFVSVTPDHIELRGISQRREVSAEISGLMADKLGEGEVYELSITFVAPPEPEDKTPDPEVCELRVSEIQATDKIAFEPGLATIAASSSGTMDRIAEILNSCGPIRMEIQGHTDSQGREEMNMNLSQARANSVLNELRARRVRTSSLVAVGYGESIPIADNDTEDGREANRRIEFWLIRPDKTATEDENALDSVAAETPIDAATDENAGSGEDAPAPENTETTDASDETEDTQQETENEQN